MEHVNKKTIIANVAFFISCFLYYSFSTFRILFCFEVLNEYFFFFSFFLFFAYDIFLAYKNNYTYFLRLYFLAKWIGVLFFVFITLSIYNVSGHLKFVGRIDDFSFYRQYILPEPGATVIVYQREKYFPLFLTQKMKKKGILIEEDEYFITSKLNGAEMKITTSNQKNKYIFNESVWEINPMN